MDSALQALYVHSANTSLAMDMTILGIYLHATFVSFTLGFLLAILAWLIQWGRTGDELFLRYSKTLSVVWLINFGLGAVTGTIVEFGLLDIWPTSILLFSSSAFIPLFWEATIAFIGEAALAGLFVLGIGRWRLRYVIPLLIATWFLGSLSGYFILDANSWMNVPWGMGNIPHVLYPFLPTYGPSVANLTATLTLAALLYHYTLSGAGSAALANPSFTGMVGTYLTNPWVVLFNPDAVVTTFHTLLAAYAVGLGAVALALSVRYLRTRDGRYMRLLRPVLWALVVVLIVQPTIVGHFMGDTVVEYQPTKFTALVTLTGGPGVYGYEFYDPIEALFAYGNPFHPIHGFGYYLDQCNYLGNMTFAQLYSEVDPDPGITQLLGPLMNTTLASNCRAAVLSLEPLAPLVSAFYYTMIGSGIVIFAAALLVLFTYLLRVPVISSITDAINNKLLAKLLRGNDNVLPALSVVMALGSAVASVAGWAAREVGRQPWTVYGLITTNEVVTSVPLTPVFVVFVMVVLIAIAVAGTLGMYYAATRPELLDRVRRVVLGGGA
ncbi:cytochrome ubiquinol oxidase subunit I [Vulcanisaeta thermophila]|uniref:cytochrome ubiquinol oxidase subunit I n=1 Tax=Vulcanisaeta thermophila TaxID=867917 RepID=UPI000853A018|nr:cytochrome ubiquinol oxidase subunit I [Vulcanisaeta thermophila]